MNITSKKSSRKLHFKSAEKFRGNISGSSKFSKMISLTSKPKWRSFKQRLRLYNITEITKLTNERPLERINRAFGIAWNTKQAYKKHYNVKKETQWARFKKLSVKKTKKDSQVKKTYNLSKQSLNFLILWESRLDTTLWRSNLVPTLKSARQFISHGFILVNEQKSKQSSRVLNPGDLIQLALPKTLKLSHNDLLQQNFKSDKQYIQQFPPFHLEVHYSSGILIFTGKPQPENLYYLYPLQLPKLL